MVVCAEAEYPAALGYIAGAVFCNTMHAMQLAALIGKVLESDNAITTICGAI